MTIERNGRKFGLLGHLNCICRVPLMSDCLSSVWGHLVHFAKFPKLRFSKGYYFCRRVFKILFLVKTKIFEIFVFDLRHLDPWSNELKTVPLVLQD